MINLSFQRVTACDNRNLHPEKEVARILHKICCLFPLFASCSIGSIDCSDCRFNFLCCAKLSKAISRLKINIRHAKT